MTTSALLDLNDTNLQLWHEDAVLQSPGYALLDGKQYTFGSTARSAARLRPRDINTRYWWQLNTERLQPALGHARHTADLVHAHLLDIHAQGGKPDELILAVPGSMARDQLALLLGIIGQCPFSATGIVNRSVLLASAHAADTSVSGNMAHLEIQLHQAVISQLAHSDGQMVLQQTTPLPGCGLLQLQERLIELIASDFVRQTRFDPRRKADSEQQLYDALPKVLQSLINNSETNVEVMGYRARINRAELRGACDLLFSSVTDTLGIAHTQDQIIIDPVAGLIPGLLEHFPQATLIENKSLPGAFARHRKFLLESKSGDEDDALPFVTSLPCEISSTSPARTPAPNEPAPIISEPTPVEPDVPAATHLLVGAVARALLPSGTPVRHDLELLRQDGSWVLRGSVNASVNGAGYNHQRPLVCGDRISCAEDENFCAQLIAVSGP
jgi:hypothetical protein